MFAPNAKRGPAKAPAHRSLPGNRYQPFYIGMDGQTIAPLAVIIAAESARRREALARAVRAARNG